MKAIINFKFDDYETEITEKDVTVDVTKVIETINSEINKFLEEKGCIEDGHASERIVDLIEKIMKDEV